MSKVRVVSVPFVNALPLTWTLAREAGPHGIDLAHASPASIPDLLESGRADVGLIPAIEYQRRPGLVLLPSLCIASRRRARSVYLASRKPLEAIRSVAVDAGSRTSVALLRIVLTRRGRGDATFHERGAALPAMLRDHDAALLIGDAALTAETSGLLVLDLAAEWRALTGLPFVFALWAVRPEMSLPDGARPFVAARRAASGAMPAIVRAAASRLGMAEAAIQEYLTENIHFDLGPEEERGLDLFCRQAQDLGLVPRHRPLLFHGGDRSIGAAARPAPAGVRP